MKINFINNKHISSKVSFGTTCSSYNSEEYGRSVSNLTEMFRSDLNWKLLTDNIVNDGIPKKIYCYACSDGSEPYSIAIALISRLGIDKAKKFFPIIAKDIDENIINKAKSGIIEFDEGDFLRMESHNINIRDFFDKKCDKFDPIFMYKKSIHSVRKNLRQCVDFKVGNIIKDAEKINYDNAIIFFRNVWIYIPKNLQNKLVEIFNHKFKDTSKIVIGSLDLGTEALYNIPIKNRMPVTHLII